MVTKSKQTGQQDKKKARVKIKSLKLGRETVKDLTHGETEKIKGGMRARNTGAMECAGPIGTYGCTGAC